MQDDPTRAWPNTSMEPNFFRNQQADVIGGWRVKAPLPFAGDSHVAF